MRKTFIQTLVKLVEIDPNIYLIVGDLGFSVIEPFKEKFPDRFINAGIAEQNMVGVAAGLAMAGKKVFVYSIVPFVTMRCFEQIRVDLCYQNLPVRLVGVGGGLDYGPSATTHHAIEDIAIMRALPNMTVIAPGCNIEVDKLLTKANDLNGPVYFRLSNNENFDDYPLNTDIKLGKAIEVISSDKFLIFTTGNSLKLGFDVCKKLRDQGIDIGLISMPTIKPLDNDFILSKKDTLKAIFSIEEHNVIGGLGEAISSLVCQNFERKILFKSFGIPDIYFHEIGSRDYLKEKVGLGVENISAKIFKEVIL